MVQTGKRYVTPGGAVLIVVKGGPGVLADGSTELVQLDPKVADPYAGAGAAADAEDLPMGKRYKSADGVVELLVTKTGAAALRYDGTALELVQPKTLPSSD